MTHKQHLNSEGEEIPSVSQIPKIYHQDMSGFQKWICKGLHLPAEMCCARAAEEYYTEAADLGTDIHELREAFLRGETFEEGVPEYQAKVFEPVAKFYKDNQYEPLFIETQMTGQTFGGSLDGAGRFGVSFWEEQRVTFWDKRTREFLKHNPTRLPTIDALWIEDLKVKSSLDILHPLQLIGYSDLLLETKGVVADWGLIIRREKKLEKKPEIQLRAYYLPLYRAEWVASQLMYKFLNG